MKYFGRILFILTGLVGFIPTGSAEEFRHEFNNGRRDRWFVSSGDWRVQNGTLTVTGYDWVRTGTNFLEGQILSRYRLKTGTVKLRVMPLTGSKVWKREGSTFNDISAVGIILRMVKGEAHPAIVFGPDKVWLENADHKASIGPCALAANQWHDLAVVVEDKALTVWVDGQKTGTISFPATDQIGWFGLLSRCDAKFDDVVLSGDVENRYVTAPTGKPNLTVEFTEWRPERFFPADRPERSGSLYIYIRNHGEGPAILESMRLYDTLITPTQTPPWVVYLRQQPYRIEPGELGQVEVRLRDLPPFAKAYPKQDTPTTGTIGIMFRHGGGVDTRTRLALDNSATRPVQINFIGFSEDLKTLYVYLQNNERIFADRNTTYHLTGIEVNGRDQTDQARFGAKVLKDDVVPIEIALSEPLAQGRPAVVTVAFQEGFTIGHVLRAFPSRFLISMHGAKFTQYDADFVAKDLYHHGINAVAGVPGTGRFDIREYRMVGNNLASLLRFEDTPLAFLWHDEVDKPWGNPFERFRYYFDEWLAWYHAGGEELPFLISWNYVSIPRNAVPGGYINYSDASKHAYGMMGCARVQEPTFARSQGLAKGEYRLGRRPWHPYFRDCEIFIPVDNATKRSLYPLEVYQRCLTPKEIRWVQYGTLLMGAKSFSHWAYWANEPAYGFWFDKAFKAVHTIRAGYGGLQRQGEVWGFTIDPYYRRILQNVWDEVGRISAEVQAVGPLLATADVTYAAKVIGCDPAKGWGGGPSVEAAALRSGLDTVILLVLNMRYDPGEPRVPNFFAVSVPGVPNFPQAHAKVAVRVPEALKANHAFRVRSDGLTDLKPAMGPDRTLVFDFPHLIVSDLVVITSRKDVRDRCAEKLKEMQARLHAGKIDPTPTVQDPVCPLPRLPTYQELKKEKS